ncbi:MAG: hypothetical protein DRO40_00535 [Thermoprotei archaeon]|nr:MAG: hypothetical protein DRO40_00535 [Thermoprotei archaeon]
MIKLKKLAYIILSGFRLILLILQISSIYLAYKLRLWLIRWSSTRRFRKILKRNDLPSDLISELELIYAKELKKKLKVSIMRLGFAR